mgnify:CR=1 FL=1
MIKIYLTFYIYVYIYKMILSLIGLQITNGIAVIQRVLRALHSCINNDTVEEIIGVSSDESLNGDERRVGLTVDSDDTF